MSNYSQALAFAAAFCSSAEHCSTEILDKISKFDLEIDDQNKLISRLKEEGFLDEKRYVHAFVKDRFRFNKWGRIKIRYMLKQKRISSELIEDGLTQIDDADYQEMLLTLLKQKKATVKSKNDHDLKIKLLRFGMGKGFEPSTILSCLRTLNIADTDEE